MRRAVRLAFLAVATACDQPLSRCTTPDTSGAFDGDTFRPTSCYHAIPTPAETLELLRGSWLFATGGSNVWATFMALGNQLDPRRLVYEEVGTHTPKWLDMIWQEQADGSTVSYVRPDDLEAMKMDMVQLERIMQAQAPADGRTGPVVGVATAAGDVDALALYAGLRRLGMEQVDGAGGPGSEGRERRWCRRREVLRQLRREARAVSSQHDDGYDLEHGRAQVLSEVKKIPHQTKHPK